MSVTSIAGNGGVIRTGGISAPPAVSHMDRKHSGGSAPVHMHTVAATATSGSSGSGSGGGGGRIRIEPTLEWAVRLFKRFGINSLTAELMRSAKVEANVPSRALHFWRALHSLVLLRFIKFDVLVSNTAAAAGVIESTIAQSWTRANDTAGCIEFVLYQLRGWGYDSPLTEHASCRQLLLAFGWLLTDWKRPARPEPITADFKSNRYHKSMNDKQTANAPPAAVDQFFDLALIVLCDDVRSGRFIESDALRSRFVSRRIPPPALTASSGAESGAEGGDNASRTDSSIVINSLQSTHGKLLHGIKSLTSTHDRYTQLSIALAHHQMKVGIKSNHILTPSELSLCRPLDSASAGSGGDTGSGSGSGAVVYMKSVDRFTADTAGSEEWQTHESLWWQWLQSAASEEHKHQILTAQHHQQQMQKQSRQPQPNRPPVAPSPTPPPPQLITLDSGIEAWLNARRSPVRMKRRYFIASATAASPELSAAVDDSSAAVYQLLRPLWSVPPAVWDAHTSVDHHSVSPTDSGGGDQAVGSDELQRRLTTAKLRSVQSFATPHLVIVLICGVVSCC